MIYPEKVKLVIWDLDDTFWSGTLSEGPVSKNERNIEIVKILTERGIVNTVSSKNEKISAEEKLKEIGVLDYFVFNKISWSPKGSQINDTIYNMGLRACNCIFIDDNVLNLKEVEASCPGIFVYLPEEILPILLDLDCAKGKDDRDLTRLKQYRILENKSIDKLSLKQSNFEFLRQCDINVKFDFDCEKYLERILELIERTNQLNFTKKRLYTEGQKEDFIFLLSHYQTTAAVILCSDKYGDYGVVGFYLLRKENDKIGKLEHFVFSCRIMNMGVESYVYEIIGRPKLEVVKPVAYELSDYLNVDWISDGSSCVADDLDLSSMLLGPCHLLQLSNFFNTDLGFFQYVKNNSIVKFDCPSFILSSKNSIIHSSFVSSGYTWSIEEYDNFHKNLPIVDLLVISLEDILLDNTYIYESGNLFRYEGAHSVNFSVKRLHINERVTLLIEIIEFLIASVSDSCDIYILDGFFSKNTPDYAASARLVYSHVIRKHFNNRLNIIDLSSYEVCSGNYVDDGFHLDRLSYYKIFNDIKKREIKLKLSDYTVFDKPLDKKVLYRLKLLRIFGSDSFLFSVIVKSYRFIKFLSKKLSN